MAIDSFGCPSLTEFVFLKFMCRAHVLTYDLGFEFGLGPMFMIVLIILP